MSDLAQPHSEQRSPHEPVRDARTRDYAVSSRTALILLGALLFLLWLGGIAGLIIGYLGWVETMDRFQNLTGF